MKKRLTAAMMMVMLTVSPLAACSKAPDSSSNTETGISSQAEAAADTFLESPKTASAK